MKLSLGWGFFSAKYVGGIIVIISNDVFIPTFENGWTIKSWSKYIEKGENYYGLPPEPPVVDEIVVVDEIDESFADGINNEKEPSSSLSSIMTMDKVSSSQPPPKKKAKVVKQTTKNAATTTTTTSTTQHSLLLKAHLKKI